MILSEKVFHIQIHNSFSNAARSCMVRKLHMRTLTIVSCMAGLSIYSLAFAAA